MNVQSSVQLAMRGGGRQGLTLLLLGASTLAGAQNAATATTLPVQAQQPAQLQEIIITAEKRKEPLMQTPVTVTVVSGDTLRQRHEVSMVDYLAEVPGVSVQNGSNGEIGISIRGLGTSEFLAPTVGIEVDDIPIGSSTAAGDPAVRPNLDPRDMQNIQVLYGPQGTLYGANAMGGLFLFTTIKPDLNRYSGSVEADTSSASDGGWGSGERVSFNAPLIDGKLAVRMSGFLRHDPGFIDDVQSGAHNVNDASTRGGRFDVLWQLTDNASLRLNALAQDGNSNGDNAELVTPSLQPADGDLTNTGIAGTGGFSHKYRFYTGTLDVDLGWAHFLSLTGYSTTTTQARLDLTPVFGPILGTPPFIIFPLNEGFGTRKFSQELRLTSPSDQTLSWIAGLFYTREATNEGQTIIAYDTTTGGPPTFIPALIAQTSDTPSIYREYSGYGTLTYHMTTRFDVQAGARYSHEVQDVPIGTVTGLLASPPTPATTQNDNSTTFLAGVRYHLSADQMAYLRVASGYRPGGANSVLPGVPATYGPDKTVNYEVGFKGSYLDHRMQLQTALFYIDWSNIQLQTVNEFEEGYNVNGNKAKSEGAQFTGQYLIGHGLSAALNVVYADAALKQAGPASSGALAGAPLPYSNKWGGNFTLEERFPVSAQWTGSAQMIYDYFGDRYADFNSTAVLSQFKPQLFLPSYSTVDLLAGLDNGRYSVNLFLRNLTNKRGINSISYLGGGVAADRSAELINPRTIGLSLAARF